MQDAVDRRKYATPVGDQGKTSRCSAFAWTHCAELISNMKGGNALRLSPSFTMPEFQRMKGDAQDYEYAYDGGGGTIGGPDPGRVLAEQGTCRQEYWPDASPQPAPPERLLIADAQKHGMDATPHPIALKDVKKALSAGCPVHVAMNTGTAFANLAATEFLTRPNGSRAAQAVRDADRGLHREFLHRQEFMGAVVGATRDTAYIPKSVLAESDAEFVAALVKK